MVWSAPAYYAPHLSLQHRPTAMAAASPLSVDDLGSTPPAAASHAPQQHADLLAPLPRREPADRLPLTRSEVPQLVLPGPVVPPWIPDMAGRHRFGTFQPPPPALLCGSAQMPARAARTPVRLVAPGPGNVCADSHAHVGGA